MGEVGRAAGKLNRTGVEDWNAGKGGYGGGEQTDKS